MMVKPIIEVDDKDVTSWWCKNWWRRINFV